MQRFLGSVQDLGDREVGVIVATDQLARDGHVLEPSGIDLTAYRSNPIVLWQHIPEEPVGACTAIAVENGALAARVQFAPLGASAKADEVCALVKAGIVRGISAGFDPTDAEPLDPVKGTRGGMHITASELLEVSFCAVPVDIGAVVVARSFAARPGAAAMLRSLPAVSQRAIARALGQVDRVRAQQVPVMAMSERARTRHYAEMHRQRTMLAWSSGYARDVEQRDDYAQRQAELRALSKDSTH